MTTGRAANRASCRICWTSADAVHPGHVHVADDQIILPRPQGVPAVHAVDGHIDGEPPALQELPLQLADGDRVVDDQHPLDPRAGRARRRRRRRRRPEPTAAEQVVDRPDEVLDVDDQHRRAVLQHRGAVDVRHLAEPGVERADVQVTLAQESLDDHAEAVAAVGLTTTTGSSSSVRCGRAQLEHLRGGDQADPLVVELEEVAALDHLDGCRGAPRRSGRAGSAGRRTARRRCRPARPGSPTS